MLWGEPLRFGVLQFWLYIKGKIGVSSKVCGLCGGLGLFATHIGGLDGLYGLIWFVFMLVDGWRCNLWMIDVGSSEGCAFAAAMEGMERLLFVVKKIGFGGCSASGGLCCQNVFDGGVGAV